MSDRVAIAGSQAVTAVTLQRTIPAPAASAAAETGRRTQSQRRCIQREPIMIAGPDLRISGLAISSVALLQHEFGTNSAKYGALSTPNGQVEIVGAEHGSTYVLTWTERAGPAIAAPPEDEGFGATLTRATVSGQLGGKMSQDWRPEGLVIRLSLPREHLTG
jgi:two-component sensor histidine kinase